MSFEAAWSLQTALFDRLSQDAALQALLGNPARIHDAIPSDAVFPLLQIGAGKIAPYSGIEGAIEHTLRFSAFSRWGGRKEGKLIADRVRQLLQNLRLPIDGHVIVQSRMVFEDHLRFRDPDTFQATMRYRIVTIPDSIASAA
ncbi:DUF3168 domain-containing protein [Parvularcula lutaonensis]|uniref:DUF3168 domain-containing protein n=1 Tax=Parvularcula lutaonensis TaxID=491923 RepID=A0ABV7MFX5_9PROT|nr:DUF3168 domain-containing protein [Parvularcula lutaonensis]GGY53203.1 hypothetical protein GCM10007148_23050 [Parvularcula lutaonensis]